MNIHVQGFGWRYVHSPPEDIRGTAEAYGNRVFNLRRTCQRVSPSGYTIFMPISRMCFQFLDILSDTLISS